MTDSPLLELRGVSKHFGAVIALHEVDFKVYPGCVTSSGTTVPASPR